MRLIDADNIVNYEAEVNMSCGDLSGLLRLTILPVEHLKDIPTAYDIERVITKVKESYDACDSCQSPTRHECTAANCVIREIIDIIRSGGK